jgi:putative endonuclease
LAKTSKQQTGIFGEEAASTYLIENGYKVITRNYRFKRGEIDIIAQKDDKYIFIEVKTRSRNDFGNPEDFVDERKQIEIIRTAEAFLEEQHHEGEIRFDIISVKNQGNENTPIIYHIEDAFFPIE